MIEICGIYLKKTTDLKFKRLWKIHDLEKLSLTLKVSEHIIEICKELNHHYPATRYPLELE
ncbi:MAG: hypothetical protein QMD21_06790 [Candidatus Thermoplasmatota archaeon]|nr:hypothetical protein [Candidatus Thermoplasmatota archaeon]